MAQLHHSLTTIQNPQAPEDGRCVLLSLTRDLARAWELLTGLRWM